MDFGEVPVAQAVGGILAHSHRLGGGQALRKGLVLTPEHVQALRDAGHEHVIVARLGPDDVGEDDAAAELAAVVVGQGVDRAGARTGRVNLFARHSGVLVADVAVIDAVNAEDEGTTLSTLSQHEVVQAGELIGTIKIIPYGVPRSTLDAAIQATRGHGPAVQVAPLHPQRVGLIVSTLPGLPDRLLDRAEQAQRDRIVALGSSLVRVDRVIHTVDDVAAALRAHHEAGLDLVLFLGASAIVDRRDVMPAALVRAGGAVIQLGMPVDPGNLLLLGTLGERPVIGLPGCARSAKPSGFDQVLRCTLAGVSVGPADLRRMGVGGLLKEIPARPAPRQGPPAKQRRVAAVVLAAGGSRRMGANNKLLVDLDGEPLVLRTVRTLLSSAARPVVVVTGHEHQAVRAQLTGLEVQIVHNPAWADGMSTSIRAGLQALPDTVDGAMIALGDMPFVRSMDLEALIDAFHPDGGAPICVPVHDRKRGHPVLWARRYFAGLCGLSGDVGARSLLDAHADDVVLVPVDDPGVHVDVDTPEALAAVRAGGLPDLSRP